VRPEALDALRGVELILHAGDVGGSEVLETLKAIAPVVAVRGNNDKGDWVEELPHSHVVEIAAAHIYLLYDVNIELLLSEETKSLLARLQSRRGVYKLSPTCGYEPASQ
jgi:predicted phosphodiesterase